VLFLDDDPQRASVFLGEHPQAVWVQTVAECIARLEEAWDEVHLDHDLGGEHFVDFEREDCGMEVVRWICRAPRPHLRATRFTVHSHNPGGATLMGMQMLANGYLVEVRPFGAPPLPTDDATPAAASPLAALTRLVRRLLGRPDPAEHYGYTEFSREEPGPGEVPLERPDFGWILPERDEHGRQA
jgi:hypothetical protein